MDLEDEDVWLRHRVRRLRTILRYVRDSRAEVALQELIGEAEERLDELVKRRETKGNAKR